MNAHYTKILIDTFPAIFAQRFYFEVGDGWFELIYDLCKKLENTSRSPKASQVKEKFGGLKFYVDDETPAQTKLISTAEKASYEICEKCGVPGDTKEETKVSWIKTRCKEHK